MVQDGIIIGTSGFGKSRMEEMNGFGESISLYFLPEYMRWIWKQQSTCQIIVKAGDNAMKRNSTPFNMAEYDKQIKRTLPFYEEMFRQVVDFWSIKSGE